MPVDGKVALAFIGTGGRARWHLGQALKRSDTTIAGLCDTSPESLAATVERVPECAEAPRFSDYREMLHETKPDGVIISIPHALHYEAIVASLEQGAAVLTEKPMVCTAEHARHVLQLRDRHKAVLSVGYQRHYQGVWRWVHKHVAGGEFGPVHFIEAWQCQNWRGRGWRGIPELSCGGQLNDSGGHLVDILLWSTGVRPSQVCAYQENRGITVDRNSVIAFRFPTEGLGTINIIGDAQRKFDEGAQIWCQNARIRIEGLGGDCRLRIYQDDTREVPPEDCPDYPVDELSNFVLSILGQDTPQATGESGLAATAFIEAAVRSARDGRAVTL